MGRPNEIEKDLTDEELDRIVDDILDTPAQPDLRGRFVCRRCGTEFRSEKKAPTLCPDCRSKIASETGQIGGRISKALQAAKKQREGSDAPPHPALRGHLPLRGEGSGPENGEPAADAPRFVGPKGERAIREEPTQETRPEAVPEPDPPYLTVRNLLDLLARVPDPERVPVMLGDQTATGLELRSVWRIGGETSAVIIIRNE